MPPKNPPPFAISTRPMHEFLHGVPLVRVRPDYKGYSEVLKIPPRDRVQAVLRPPRVATPSQEAEVSFNIGDRVKCHLGVGWVVPETASTPHILPGQLLVQIRKNGRPQLFGLYPHELNLV